jgi:sterol O-acyltransferase
VSNFAQVVACLFYIYYILVRFCVPYFHNFNQEHVTPKVLLMTTFGCMLPGTLVLFIGEYQSNE